MRKLTAGTARLRPAPRPGRADSDRDHFFSTRVPRRVHKELKALAIASERPLYELLIEAFEEYLILRRGGEHQGAG
jgi:hypothetical protein